MPTVTIIALAGLAGWNLHKASRFFALVICRRDKATHEILLSRWQRALDDERKVHLVRFPVKIPTDPWASRVK